MGDAHRADVQRYFRAVPLVRHSAADPRSGGAGHRRSGEERRWLLAVTAALAYAFTLFSGFGTYLVGRAVFPALLEGSQAVLPDDAGAALTPYFTVQMPPLFGVMSALVLAFVLGLGMAYYP